MKAVDLAVPIEKVRCRIRDDSCPFADEEAVALCHSQKESPLPLFVIIRVHSRIRRPFVEAVVRGHFHPGPGL